MSARLSRQLNASTCGTAQGLPNSLGRLLGAGGMLFILPALGADRTFLPGIAPLVVAHLFLPGRLQDINRLELAIGLPLRNQLALTALLQQTYDPASTTSFII